MAKIQLTANPTYKAKVSIPVPGSRAAEVEFTFKARPKPEFKEFMESLRDREDIDVVMDCVCGWELDDAFSRENVAKLLDSYIGSARAIITKYIEETTAQRLGN